VAATICPRPTLTFDLEVGMGVACDQGTPVQSFVFLGLLVFELRADVLDIRQTDADHRLMPQPPPTGGGGHNNFSWQYFDGERRMQVGCAKIASHGQYLSIECCQRFDRRVYKGCVLCLRSPAVRLALKDLQCKISPAVGKHILLLNPVLSQQCESIEGSFITEASVEHSCFSVTL